MKGYLISRQNEISSFFSTLKGTTDILLNALILQRLVEVLQVILLMSKAKSPQKGTRVKDPVSQERVFRERLHKEYVSQKINQDFKINQPEKVAFYTEKPNNNPYLLMKMRGEGRTINGVDYDDKLRDGHYKTQLTADINDKLKTVTHTPKDKWDVPQTSNQEIGWLAEKRFEEGSKFVHRREGCPETHYADSYYTMKHVSLFSNKSQK